MPEQWIRLGTGVSLDIGGDVSFQIDIPKVLRHLME
jgi:hypothetical protein